MVIEVELNGLIFNDNKRPADWENWRDLGNNVYAVQYKPSGFLNAVTINLLPTITNTSQTCSITLQSQGYYTQTSPLKIIHTITIPISSVIDLGTNNVNTLRSISVGNGGTVTYSDYKFGTRVEYGWLWDTTYYTIQFTDLEFKGTDINDNTQVTIITSNGANGTQRTTRTTIGALRGN